ncbi:hypothetical protein D3C86_1210690 [compost metagenome]
MLLRPAWGRQAHLELARLLGEVEQVALLRLPAKAADLIELPIGATPDAECRLARARGKVRGDSLGRDRLDEPIPEGRRRDALGDGDGLRGDLLRRDAADGALLDRRATLLLERDLGPVRIPSDQEDGLARAAAARGQAVASHAAGLAVEERAQPLGGGERLLEQGLAPPETRQLRLLQTRDRPNDGSIGDRRGRIGGRGRMAASREQEAA